MKKVTLFKNIWDTQQPHYITIAEAIERIQNRESAEAVTAYRNEKDPAKKATLKKALPSVCFSGTFKAGRQDSDLITHSGLAILDFDKVGDAESLRESLSADPYIFATWISPSGNGVKALVRIPADGKTHKLHYSALLERFPIAGRDDSNSNVSRVCFESVDPDLYINWNSLVFTEKKIEGEIREPQSAEGGKIPKNAIKDPAKIYSILKTWMDKRDTFAEGNMHNFYVKFAFNLCECGVSLEDSIEWLMRDYIPINEGEAEKAIKSGWKSKEAKFESKFFEDKDKAKMEFLTFWYVVEANESKKVIFDKTKFIEWLHSQGISRYKFADGQWMMIIIRDQVARQIYRPEIKHITIDYIKSLPPEFDGIHRVQLLELIAKGVSAYFSEEYLDLLNEIPINWNRDTVRQSFFYYQNCVVRVDDTGYFPEPYGRLPGVIWESQIIDRAFVKTDNYHNEFRQFCKNVCGKDPTRYESLKSIIGYLLSSHKDPNEFPVVVLMDEQMAVSEHPEGGTGKGIFSKAIRKIKGGVVIDGKNWTTEKSFAWQRIELDTRLIILEDVEKKFQFEKFFSITAEGMEVEKKNQQSFYINFADGPKWIITTNYTIEGIGGSNARRLVEIEFAPHYSEDFTPVMEFGRLLFDDWNENDWNAFDNYMMGCGVYYIRNKVMPDENGLCRMAGIIKPIDINISERKLNQSTSEEFTAWADAQITFGQKYDRKKDLFSYFVNANQEFSKLTPRTFNSWLQAWAKYRGVEMEKSKSGNDFFYTFLKKTTDSEPEPKTYKPGDDLPF